MTEENKMTAEQCYDYARDVLKGAFPAGEKAIANDSEWSYRYARDILNGPFHVGNGEVAE